jgi:hypothetical protein
MSESIPIPPEVLAYPEDSQAFTMWARFRRFAAYMAARYNGPVFLVGSCLRSGHYRDVDIRIEISDEEFKGRYGVTHEQWVQLGPPQRWIDDMANYNGEIARDFHVIPDFQVYGARQAVQYRDQPKLLLAAPANCDPVGDVIAHDDALSAALSRANE